MDPLGNNWNRVFFFLAHSTIVRFRNPQNSKGNYYPKGPKDPIIRYLGLG